MQFSPVLAGEHDAAQSLDVRESSPTAGTAAKECGNATSSALVFTEHALLESCVPGMEQSINRQQTHRRALAPASCLPFIAGQLGCL
jgi:hypothetical protein